MARHVSIPWTEIFSPLVARGYGFPARLYLLIYPRASFPDPFRRYRHGRLFAERNVEVSGNNGAAGSGKHGGRTTMRKAFRAVSLFLPRTSAERTCFNLSLPHCSVSTTMRRTRGCSLSSSSFIFFSPPPPPHYPILARFRVYSPPCRHRRDNAISFGALFPRISFFGEKIGDGRSLVNRVEIKDRTRIEWTPCNL